MFNICFASALNLTSLLWRHYLPQDVAAPVKTTLTRRTKNVIVDMFKKCFAVCLVNENIKC